MTDNWFEPENICHDIVSPKFYGKINYSSNDAQDLWQKNMTQAIMKIQVAENDVLIYIQHLTVGFFFGNPFLK